MFGSAPVWIYPAAIAASVGVGAGVFLWRIRKGRIAPLRVLVFIAGIAVSAILGGRLHMLLESSDAWRWTALFETGYRHPGAIVGAALALVILRRVCLPRLSLARLADALAPPAAFALGTMRVGCFAAGCCFGTVSDVPWAVRFPMGSLAANLHSTMGWLEHGATTSLPVHPLQLYFAALGIGTGMFLLWLERRQSYAGEIALTFLAVHETGKFLLEFLRAPGLTPAPTQVQLFSFGVALAAVCALALLALIGIARPRRLTA